MNAVRALLASLSFLAACQRTPVPDPALHAEGTVALGASASATPVTLDAGKAVVMTDETALPLLDLVHAPADASVLATIRTERLVAEKQGRTLLVLVGASWCPPCRELHARLKKQTIRANVRLLEFDVDAHDEGLKAAGYVSQAIPLLAKPRPDGRADSLVEVPSKEREGADLLVAKLRELSSPGSKARD